MTRLTEERTALYTRAPTPGGRFPIVVNPFLILDELSTDSKIWDGLCRLRNRMAAGAGGMHAEHLKDWLLGVVEEEEKGTEGAGDKWRLLISTVHLGAWMHP